MTCFSIVSPFGLVRSAKSCTHSALVRFHRDGVAFPTNSCSTALSYQPQQRKSQPDNVAQLVSREHLTLSVMKTRHIRHSCDKLIIVSLTNAAGQEHQTMCHPRCIFHLLAMHESFPPMYGGQVILWTQRKRQAENLVGGGLGLICQGGSSSAHQGKLPNLAH